MNSFSNTSFSTHQSIINPACLSDVQDFISLQGNGNVRKYLGGVVNEKAATEKFKEKLKNKKEILLVARSIRNHECIGFIYLTPYKDSIHIELSYEFHPNYWGRGYACEILIIIIRFAFQEVKINELYAETQVKNTASCKLLEKLSFKKVGQIERYGSLQYIYCISQ